MNPDPLGSAFNHGLDPDLYSNTDPGSMGEIRSKPLEKQSERIFSPRTLEKLKVTIATSRRTNLQCVGSDLRKSLEKY